MASGLKRIDIACVVCLFVAAVTLSGAYLAKQGLGAFYQVRFSPAVILACTGKLQSLRLTADRENPALAAFLARDASSFDCSTLPRGLVAKPLDGFEIDHLYLLGSAAALWAVFGVKWSVLIALPSLFAGAIAVSIYGIARLFVPVPWAIAVVLAAMLSPLHVAMLPEIRDYSRAPFILAAIFLAGYLVSADHSWRRIWIVAGLAGLIVGLGRGFRPDVFLAIPFLGLMSLLLVREASLRAVSGALISVGILLLMFIIATIPIISARPSDGGGMGHVVLLGLTQPFNPKLGLDFPIYDIGHRYNDIYIFQFVSAYASRFYGEQVPALAIGTMEYDRQLLRAIYDFFVNFPADVVVRVYASTLRVLNLEFFDFNQIQVPRFLLELRSFLIAPSIGVIFATVAAIYLWIAAPRLSAFFVLLVMFFAGSGALQFDLRHLFYLEFVYWLSLSIVVYAAVGQVMKLAASGARSPASLRRMSGHLLRALAVPGSCLVLAVAALELARAYQQRHVTRLVEELLAAPRQTASAVEREVGDETVILPSTGFRNAGLNPISAGRITWAYYVATLDAARCSGQVFRMRVSFRATDPYWDMSRDIAVPLGRGGASAYAIFPVIQESSSAFDGIRVRRDQRHCLQRLEAVPAAASMPLPLWLQLSPDWRDKPLYQTFADRALFSNPPDLLHQPAGLMRIAPLGEGAWQDTAASARVMGAGLRLQGRPSHPHAYAAVSRRYALAKGTLVAAAGKVSRGGIVLGLLDHRGQWAITVQVVPGAFLAAVEVPSNGEYHVVVANHLPGRLSVNNVDVKEIGFLTFDSAIANR